MFWHYYDSSCRLLTISLATIGLITVVLLLFDTLCSFLQVFRALLAPYLLPQEPDTLVKKYGSWALVTGCTDGIGKAYANELAKRGLNIVLVSRSRDRLLMTAREIESAYDVKTKIIAADFTSCAKAVAIVKEELDNLPIGILVNNVGKQHTYPMYLDEAPKKELLDIINVNVGAVTLMTRLLIKGMKERRRGAIVNVSSGAECQPMPLMNVYSASKVYIKYFTEALREEYIKYGITVQHLSPFFLNTKMNHFSDRLQENSFFVPDANTYAKYAVSMLGKVDHSTGYWTHGIQHFFTTIPPLWIRTKIAGQLNKSFRKDYFLQRSQQQRKTEE